MGRVLRFEAVGKGWDRSSVSWMHRHTYALVAAGFLAGVITCHSDTVAINPVADNSLFQDGSGNLSGGALPNLFVGKTFQNSTGLIRRALVRFDIGASVPAGSTITSAVLRVTVNQSVTAGQITYLLRASNAWGEGSSYIDGAGGGGAVSSNQDATWIHTFFNTSFWNSAGGDYAPVESAFMNIGGGGTYEFAASQVISDVQSWLDGSTANNGWLIRTSTETLGNSFRIASRENATSADRPTLTIGFIAATQQHASVTFTRTTNGFVNAWSAVTGRIYQMEFTTNLLGTPTWAAVGAVTAAGTTASITDTNRTSGRSYRVMELQF
jgi:hypothetical protein